MNSFTNTMLTVMLGWLRTLLNAVSGLLTSDSSTVFLDFMRSSWRVIFIVLCIGGFALDKIVYIIRWRPKPIWLRRRRRQKNVRPYRDPYAQPLYDGSGMPQDGARQDAYDAAYADPYAQPYAQPYTQTYAAAYAQPNDDPYADPYTAGAPYAGEAQTRQYQIQPAQYRPEGAETQVYQPYATPQYAPQAMQEEYVDGQAAARWEEDAQTQGFAPVQEERQRFAFGMEPSFGSAQNEPAYTYHPDAMRTFAPPQQAQAEYLPDPYAPPAYAPPQEDAFGAETPFDGENENPRFRPFAERGGDPGAAAKTRGLSTVAKKARSLFNPEEAYESLTYQDLQPAVDRSKAFHAPVYPEKKPEGDA